MPPAESIRDAANAPVALDLARPEATDALGRRLAGALGRGDVVTLSGQLGAGKSHLARAIVRTLLGDAEAQVPSPSYTLVNVYETGASEIWHADLYRLAGGDEIAELGLDDAGARALMLVEWPDRWQPPPPRRLEIALVATGAESRRATLTAIGAGWEPALRAARP